MRLTAVKRAWLEEGLRGAAREAYGRFLVKIGERAGVDRLIYNRAIMYGFLQNGRKAAPCVIDAICQRYPFIQSAVDLGCGPGAYVEAFRRHGVACTGYEYSQIARQLGRDKLGVIIQPFDLNTHIVMAQADVAISLEVAEHIPPILGDRLVALAAQAATLVIFSAARPGQPGQGHINCQPEEYWRERFLRNGMAFCDVETQALRTQLKATLPPEIWWLRENIQVFRAQGTHVEAS